jgi:hypothetical protein
VGKLHDFCPR